MKKVIVFFLGVLLFGCERENKFTIDGQIDNTEEQTIYFKELTVSDERVLDSASLEEDGAFSFSGETEYPRFYQIALEDKFATLLIKPGEDLKFRTDANSFYDYMVEGSPGSQQVKKLESRLRYTKSRLDSLRRIYMKFQKQGARAQRIEEINEAYRKILNRQRDSSIAFILDHMGSLASIMVLYQKVDEETFVLYKNIDLQYIKLVADSLKDKYPQSEHVKSLLANKDDLMKKYRNLELQQKLSQLVGESVGYPNIRLPNLEGDTISLHGLNDKMILLSFWASWSTQSIQRNLALMDIYRRYHDKGFEIYQVSLDESREEWQSAVRFDQLPWVNVSGLNGMQSYPAKIYNVQDLPTDYLIHQERGLLNRNPSKEELKRKLSIALD